MRKLKNRSKLRRQVFRLIKFRLRLNYGIAYMKLVGIINIDINAEKRLAIFLTILSVRYLVILGLLCR